MKIDILICTYNEGIKRIKDLILPQQEDISYKISHQVTRSIEMDDCEFLSRSDIEYCVIKSRGLSKNRNNVLRMASGDICFIADDDVKYDLDNIRVVARTFSENPLMDLYIGKIKTYDDEPEYKKYSPNKKRMRWKDIFSVSSIEIVFKREAIIKKGITFDVRFGLGGDLYTRGEEGVFLSDCLKNNLRIIYFPQYIVKHPKESSTSGILYDVKEVEYRGGVCKRIFNKFAFMTGMYFCIRHYQRYKTYLSPLEYMRYFYRGIKKYKKYSVNLS